MLLSKKKIERIGRDLGNFLVFGTGKDTPHWREANSGGKTVFLEDLQEWIPKDHHDVMMIKYTLDSTDYLQIFEDHVLAGNLSILENPLEKVLETTRWDNILVDGPQGWIKKGKHGRMESIFLARRLCSPDTTVFIDDFERKIENLYGTHFFVVEEMVDNMAVCKPKT